MKNIFKLLMITLLVGTAISCSDSEAVINQVLDNVDSESGAVIRTVVAPPELVSLTNETNNVLRYTLEVQQGNGTFVPDFKEVRTYMAIFQDQDLINPIVDGSGNPIGEVLFVTNAASEFAIGPNGLPRISSETPTQAILDAFPEGAVLTTPSFISMRLELEMNDGTVFTNTNLGASVSGGPYFGASFLYKIIFLPI